MHIVVVSLAVKFYAERRKDKECPTVKEIYMRMNEEEMHFGEKGEG